MSQWNLSVRLSGQGSDLVTTLRRSSAEARKLQRDIAAARREITQLRQAARSPIRIGVTIDARNLRREVQQAARGAGGQRITIPLSIDGRGLRQQVRTALASAGTGNRLRIPLAVDASRIRQEVRRAVTTAGAGNRITIPLHVDSDRFAAALQRATAQASAGLGRLQEAAQNTSHSLNSLQRYTREAGNELQELRTHALGAAAALRAVNTAAGSADGRLSTLSTRSRTLSTDLDGLDGAAQRASGSLGGLRGNLGSLGAAGSSSSRSVRGLLVLLAGLATAAIPAAASLVTAAAPIAATFGAAGASATAFGIALAGQVGALGDAADAQTKYDEAVRDHGATSKEAAEAQQALQAQLAAMPAPTRQASAALSSLKTQYQDWSDSLAGSTMPVAVKGFQTMSAVIPKLTPLVKSSANEFDRLITLTAGGINSSAFDELFADFDRFAAGSMDEVVDGIVHLLRVLSGDSVPGSSALREFMDYARSAGPQVAQTLRSLGDAFMNVLEASADMGVTALTVVNALAQLVSAVPPGVLSVFLQLALALKAVQLAAGGFAVVSGLVAAFAAQLGVARTAAAGAAGPLASAAAGFMALSRAAKVAVIGTAIGAIVVALSQLSDIGKSTPPDVDKLTTSLGNFARTGKVAGEAARVFGSDLSGLSDALRTLARPSNAEGVQQWLTKLIGMDSTPVADAKEKIDGLDKALANLVKNGNPQLAEAAFQRAAKAMKGLSAKELKGQLDDYKSALADAAFEQQLAAQSMGLFGQQAQATSAKLDAQKASADGLRQAIQALNDANRAGLGGMIGFEAAIDAAAEAAKKNAGALTMTGGQLNLNSEKARTAATALNDLAAKTDEAAASARQSGASWETVNGIYQRGRNQLVASAMQMGLTSAQARALASSILTIPDKKSTQIEMKKEDALAGLNAVSAKLKETPDAKSITVKALSQSAIDALTAVGFEVQRLPDGTVKVSALTDEAKANLAALITGVQSVPAGKSVTIDAQVVAAVRDLEALKAKVAGTHGKTITMNVPTAEGRRQLELLGFKIQSTKGKTVTVAVPTGTPRSQVAAIQAAINSLRGKTVTNTVRTNYVQVGNPQTQFGGPDLYKNARGSVMDFYARGGIRRGRVQQFAGGGFASGDRPNQHVAQIAPAGSYRVWGERETQGEGYVPFRRSGRPRSRAITEEIVRRLGGDPSSVQWNASGGVTRFAGGGMDFSYSASSSGPYSLSSLISGSQDKNGKFSLSTFAKKLQASDAALATWRKNLAAVASRAGQDVADALEDMGEDGIELTKKMATGSSSYINSMAKDLRNLANAAKASLGEYTSKMKQAVKNQNTFQADLAKLAAMGFGDLAGRLAKQNDQAAADLASQAARDRNKAAAANQAAKSANSTLDSEQVTQLVQIIAAISKSTTGIHDVAAATGLGEDDIVAVATKARAQISSSLGSRAGRFLSDLGKAQKGLAYANGGIRPGIYGTRAGAVTFAEPATGGEAYIPLGANKRASATRVLGDVAGRFGLGLQDAGSRVVVIREQGPLVGSQNFQISSGGNATDTARQVESRTAYQLRRLARGGAR
ncbi:hypothetical protein [Streptomyces sp. NPDC017529]|uniref:hypothetical protein n=1 Tax=Streptomyces sp. NPDC017529 TaxID=3365000 RepID=UPI00378C15ED